MAFLFRRGKPANIGAEGSGPADYSPPSDYKMPFDVATEVALAADVESWLVTVDVIQAKDLIAADKAVISASSDPYALVSLRLQNGEYSNEMKSRIVTKCLNPVFNERFDFVCYAKPVAVKIRMMDFDMGTKDDPLGWAEYELLDEHFATGPKPHSWITLQSVRSGRVQICASVLHKINGNSATASESAATAIDCIGLTTFRIAGLRGFKPGPYACKLIKKDTFNKGQYALKAVLTFGLRHYNSRSIPGVPIAKATSGSAAEGVGEVSFGQDCRIWVREEEKKYIACVTLYATTSEEDGQRIVPLGRAYLNTESLQDGLVNVFNLTLYEESESEMELTDAEHTDLIVGSVKPAALPVATPPPSASASEVSAITGDSGSVRPVLHHAASVTEATVDLDGSGFRDDNDININTDGEGSDSSENLISGPFAALNADAAKVTEVVEGKGTVVGVLSVRCQFLQRAALEEWFLRRLIASFDSDGDNTLDRTEFLAMLEALGNEFTPPTLEALFEKLDVSKDGRLDSDELVSWFRSAEFQTAPFAISLLAFLADGQEGLRTIFNDITDVARSTTAKTRSGAAILLLNEGYRQKTIDQGLRVLDRDSGLIMTEHIPQFVKMAIGLMYNGIGNKLTGSAAVRALLKRLSEREGAHMNDPASKSKIPAFVRSYNINMAECKKAISEFRNFNEFFYRELKPGARPLDAPSNDAVVVSPADCRLVLYATTTDTTSIWVKGDKFTIESLLGPECSDVAPLFLGGGFCLARLAPQDYHRYHTPVTGRFWRHHAIDGALYTVNPIAIRQARPQIYSKNKREIYLIQTVEFGLVAMVAVGATVVGSIHTVPPVGSFISRGNDHGYFAFGGSTVLILFQSGTVKFDDDLLANSMRPLETYVKVGRRVGIATRPEGGHTLGLSADDPDLIAHRARLSS